MYSSVLKVCIEHESVWDGIPGFVDAITNFNNRFDALGKAAQKQATKTTGVSAKKYAKLNELIDDLIVVHGTLKLHGKEINDPGLIARNKWVASKLRNMSIQQMMIHLDVIDEDIASFGSALSVYGVDQNILDALHSTITEARKVMNSPRNAIIERKLQTSLLDQYIDELDQILKLNLDNLVRVHKKSHPDFFNLYWNARTIIDHKSRTGLSKSADDTMPPERDDGDSEPRDEF